MGQFRRPRLSRDIAVVLVAKLLALIFIWAVWFQHPESGPLDGDAVRSHLGLSAVEPSGQSANDAGP